MVYFLQENRENGFIKVGETIRLHGVDGRLQVLRQGNPYGFKVIATCPGNKAESQILEAKIKEDLQAHNFRGEWFHPHPEVFMYIAGIPGVILDPLF